MPPTKKIKTKETIDELALEEELLRRDLAKVSLKEYAQQVYSIAEGDKYVYGRHLGLLYKELEEVEKYIRSEGKEGNGRLVISMPPRHSKSSSASVIFPTWVLGRNPTKKVMMTTYGATLSEKHSRKARDVVQSKEYSKIFGEMSNLKEKVVINPVATKVEEWEIDGYKGSYTAIGVGGASTGKGAHLLIVDDPHKDREEVESTVMRNKVWDWYTGVARTRLQKGGAIIIIMTRWHEDDLAGRVLAQGGFKELKLPAIATEDNDAIGRKIGMPLWPELYDLPALHDLRKDIGSRDWNALYQQDPSGSGDGMIKREWFRYGTFPATEDIVKCIQVWDTAYTEKTENDPSVCLTGFLLKDGSFFVADVWRGYVAAPQLKTKVMQKYLQWNEVFRVSTIYVESQGSGILLLQALKSEMSHLPAMACNTDSEYGKSKVARLSPILIYMENGQIVFLKNAPWLPEFEGELLKFPRGKNDDQVDVLVYAVSKCIGSLSRSVRATPLTLQEKLRRENTQRSSSSYRETLRANIFKGGWSW